MTTQLQFFGAAGTVTGSCYCIQHDRGRFLVDCGLFQGNKTLRELNYGDFPFDPASIDFVLLTHAHIDHSGLVPKLCGRGFTGPVYATEATRDLLTYMLPDSGHIQEFEVRRLNKRNRRRGRKAVVPIYTRADAEAALDQIRSEGFDAWFAPGPGVRARYWNAGHILGAGSVEIEIADQSRPERPLRVLFSGDIGPQEKSFHRDPEAPTHLDYLIVEGTYGDRDRDDLPPDQRRIHLRDEIVAALEAGGNLIIPAFAVERTQELLYDIGLLMADKEIPSTKVYLDSPLASRATEVFEAHADALHEVERHKGLFRHPNFRFVRDAEESMRLADITGGAIIVAASGMCEAGRVRHHLKNNLWRRQATVLFVGYQAPGTLGQLIKSGERFVRIMGEEISVEARIRSVDYYSAHADQAELVEWSVARLPVHESIFLTHGEDKALATFRDRLVDAGCAPAQIVIPEFDDRFDLAPKVGAPQRAEPRRVEPAAVKGADWHNEYAALLLRLSTELQKLPDDRSRHELLRRMREAL
jgi:metallo-beta-lactamase family protein